MPFPTYSHALFFFAKWKKEKTYVTVISRDLAWKNLADLNSMLVTFTTAFDESKEMDDKIARENCLMFMTEIANDINLNKDIIAKFDEEAFDMPSLIRMTPPQLYEESDEKSATVGAEFVEIKEKKDEEKM